MESFAYFLSTIQALAWPVVAYIIFRYFGPVLKDLLSSIKEAALERGIKVSTSGVEIPPNFDKVENIEDMIRKTTSHKHLFEQNQPEQLEGDLAIQPKNAIEVLKQHEKNLVNNIMPVLNTITEGKKSREIEPLLKGLLCEAYIYLYFERTFQRILGSQSKLLKKLLQSKNLSIQEAQTIFKSSSTHVNPSLTFENWLIFLLDSKFIEKDNDSISITNRGKEFLEYIDERGYSLTKPG